MCLDVSFVPFVVSRVLGVSKGTLVAASLSAVLVPLLGPSVLWIPFSGEEGYSCLSAFSYHVGLCLVRIVSRPLLVLSLP